LHLVFFKELTCSIFELLRSSNHFDGLGGFFEVWVELEGALDHLFAESGIAWVDHDSTAPADDLGIALHASSVHELVGELVYLFQLAGK
jgi:hypothetical protein